MKNLAFLLVVIASLAGSFLASLDETHMNWTYFVPIMLVGFIGAIWYKKMASAEAKHGSLLQTNKTILIDSLNNIVKNLQELDGRKDKIPTYNMRFEIDKVFRDDLFNFAEARDSMKHLFGIQHFADIKSSFAAGERYINRVWSASTDGYVDEVLLYVEKSLYQFKHAKQEFEKALAEN
ncbi:MAG: hypothetical protein JKY19_09730 [Alcanivoracaceae bacterium]|nr:hypothetical protein [Alcanivoracaceae bacterium]